MAVRRLEYLMILQIFPLIGLEFKMDMDLLLIYYSSLVWVCFFFLYKLVIGVRGKSALKFMRLGDHMDVLLKSNTRCSLLFCIWEERINSMCKGRSTNHILEFLIEAMQSTMQASRWRMYWNLELPSSIKWRRKGDKHGQRIFQSSTLPTYALWLRESWRLLFVHL